MIWEKCGLISAELVAGCNSFRKHLSSWTNPISEDQQKNAFKDFKRFRGLEDHFHFLSQMTYKSTLFRKRRKGISKQSNSTANKEISWAAKPCDGQLQWTWSSHKSMHLSLNIQSFINLISTQICSHLRWCNAERSSYCSMGLSLKMCF